VKQYGTESWQQISKSMPNRNSRQCKDRWTNFLSPNITKGPWEEHEEALLCQKVSDLGTSWKRIAAFFPGRSEVGVKSHWQMMQRRTEREIIQAARRSFLAPKSSPPARNDDWDFDFESLSFSGDGDHDFGSWF
jgi:hypothetical protein